MRGAPRPRRGLFEARAVNRMEDRGSALAAGVLPENQWDAAVEAARKFGIVE